MGHYRKFISHKWLHECEQMLGSLLWLCMGKNGAESLDLDELLQLHHVQNKRAPFFKPGLAEVVECQHEDTLE